MPGFICSEVYYKKIPCVDIVFINEDGNILRECIPITHQHRLVPLSDTAFIKRCEKYGVPVPARLIPARGRSSI